MQMKGMDQVLQIKISRFVKKQKIEAGLVLSCVGSLTNFAIRFANEDDALDEEGYYEIVSLSGTISVNGSHLHIAVSDEEGDTVGVDGRFGCQHE